MKNLGFKIREIKKNLKKFYNFLVKFTTKVNIIFCQKIQIAEKGPVRIFPNFARLIHLGLLLSLRKATSKTLSSLLSIIYFKTELLLFSIFQFEKLQIVAESHMLQTFTFHLFNFFFFCNSSNNWRCRSK